MESINVDTLKEMAGKFPQTVLKGITSLLSQRERPVLSVEQNGLVALAPLETVRRREYAVSSKVE